MGNRNIENIRHTLAHLLAATVRELNPKALPTIGPAIENGFYYDFDFSQDSQPGEENLAALEKKMRELLPSWKEFSHREVSADEAREAFKENKYKKELIDELEKNGETITLYKCGDFEDLCRGGHAEHPNEEIAPDSFKLERIAGAYWRGDAKNQMLTRIYGLAFETKKELDEYLKQREEAEKRDHRKLGQKLDLFTFSEHIGSGLPLYTPRGALIRTSLTNYIEEMQVKAGYTQVWTPQIAKAELFKISGHYDKYKGDMFQVVSNYSKEEFYLKPMNCPQHTQIYLSQQRSYRDLPLRYADFAMLYRDEKPGELNGLARVRSFSQDDCHIFCREDQVDEEIDRALTMIKEVMKVFGFKYRYRLSTRDPEHPEKYLGNPETWDKVEKWAEQIMKRNNIDYFDGPGEAAFYAPKMDLMATDALGREWQLSTVQIDYVQPERFDLTYINEKGETARPVMIHRAIIGSPERFMMILLEHFAGALPLWLSPTQVRILPLSEKFIKYAENLTAMLKHNSIRAELSDANETLGKRIREAEMQKIPYILVAGEREEKNNTASVRHYKQGQIGELVFSELVEKIKNEIESKTI